MAFLTRMGDDESLTSPEEFAWRLLMQMAFGSPGESQRLNGNKASFRKPEPPVPE
jgi:hypothetical protein